MSHGTIGCLVSLGLLVILLGVGYLMMQHAKRDQKCPFCNGKGRITERKVAGGGKGAGQYIMTEYWEKSCPHCGGHGYVNKSDYATLLEKKKEKDRRDAEYRAEQEQKKKAKAEAERRRYEMIYSFEDKGGKRGVKNEPRFPIEAESMEVIEELHGKAQVQDMYNWGIFRWSGKSQMLFRAEKPGARMTLQFTSPGAGSYHLNLYATYANDFGMYKFSLDETPMDKTVDAYESSVSPSGTLSFGIIQLDAGKHRLSFEVTGKRKKSRNYLFGIDCIELLPAGKESEN